MIIFVLAVLGLCLGSFVNALVWRIHKNKDWVKSRSQCVHCGHELSAKDLIPIFSWLMLKGRCRYCQKPISKQYPLVELIMATVFILSYLLWPTSFNEPGQWILFVSWLAASVGLLALAVYDWRWLLLPNKLVYPTFLVAAAGRVVYIAGYEPDKWLALLNLLGAVAVASGIFFLIYSLSDKYIGGGDVSLGLVTGTLLAIPINSLLMIFFASILGLLFALPGLVSKNKKLTTKIPYGPFLIAATFIVLLFGQGITDWYEQLLT
ncbi:TPA: hypothetical protein DIS56_02615 [Candidatus Saccharibacteria bacterium]|nr:MAG: hypothetical protein A3F05_03295 [Candidatus Saccharibacteria bacterium RIFCSPHIGHO2_12_FULL_47_17]HCM52003.1 hypothetical protein [Candidatus Saccharibacteria bacterium]